VTTETPGEQNATPRPALHPAADGAAPPSPALSSTPSTPTKGKAHALTFPPSFRVLHVEDDATLRKTMELRIFRKFAVPFDYVENGAEALRVVLDEARLYTIIIMDNQMPVLTGEKATRTLRERGHDGVIVGMTGDPAGCDEHNEFVAAGLNACHNKDSKGIKAIVDLIRSYAVLELAPSTEAD